MLKTSNKALKILSSILLLFIAIAIIVIVQNPIIKYNFSVFDGIPLWALIFLFVALIGGIGIVVHQVVLGDVQIVKWWIIGLSLVLLSNLIIILLPYLRGYAFNDNADGLTHLGYVKDILLTGHYSISNVYPGTHVLWAELSTILNVPPETMMNFIGPLCYLIFVLFTYLFTQKVLPIRAAILATLASTVLFAYYYNQVFPMGFTFSLLPLIFYLYFKFLERKSVMVATLLLIMIVTLVYFHPVCSFVVTIALVMMESAKYVYSRLSVGSKRASRLHSAQFYPSFFLISLFCLMLWIWDHFTIWNSSVLSITSWFNSELLVKPMTTIAQQNFNILGLNIIGVLFLFIKLYGATFIYLVLSLLAIFMIFRKRTKWEKTTVRNIFIYTCLFLPSVAIWLIDYIRPLTSLSSGRFICVVIVMFPLLVGLFMYLIVEGNSKESKKRTLFNILMDERVKIAVLVGIVSLCSLIAINALYPSPYTFRPYWGISHSNFDGEAWIVVNGSPVMQMLGISSPPPYRIVDVLWGVNKENTYSNLGGLQVADHFGYDSSPTLGGSIGSDKYLFLVGADRLLYSKLWPQVGRFNNEDFVKLENDPSVNEIYNNGDSQDYFVYGE